MPANLPGSPYAQTVQGPDPTGLQGYPLAVVGVSGGTPQSVSIDQSVPGTSNFVYSIGDAFRLNKQLYRSGIVAADKLSVPSSVTVVDVATGGSLLAGTTYNVTWAAGNKWGSTTVPANGSVTTAADASNTHVARVTTTQLSGADWYDLFISTAANPLWVARVTEAQRAAGCTVTAVGTVTGTSPGANKIDLQVVGTGVASNANPFANNNAFTPAGLAYIDTSGFNAIVVYAKLTVTDLRSLPTLVLSLFEKETLSPTEIFQKASATLSILNGAINPLLQGVQLQVTGSLVSIAVASLSGQGASVDLWIEMV